MRDNELYIWGAFCSFSTFLLYIPSFLPSIFRSKCFLHIPYPCHGGTLDGDKDDDYKDLM